MIRRCISFSMSNCGMKFSGRLFGGVKVDESAKLLLTDLFNVPATNNYDCSIGRLPLTDLKVSTESITDLIDLNYIQQEQCGVISFLKLTELGQLHAPIDAKNYFAKFRDFNKRNVKDTFNQNVLKVLDNTQIFSETELQHLLDLDHKYKQNKSKLSSELVLKEEKRINLDYIWKSCQLEGSEYTYEETEKLLEFGITAGRKLYTDAIMAVNHESALKFISTKSTMFNTLDLSFIEAVHMIMMRDTDISFLVRKKPVRIGGTQYRPPKSEQQLMTILTPTLNVINKQSDIFSKALVTTLLLSYLQLFEDGNKRTARMLANGILTSHDSFSFNYRNISEREYKNAILMFYERNNIHAFRELFIQQAEESVKEYYSM